MDNKYIGSFWSKWDLHLHSPFTNLNNKYNCSIAVYCNTIKEKGIKAIGLTNYFIIHEDEYNQVVNGLEKDVFVIPNIEFRTNDRNGSNEYINIHVLFNPNEISIKDLNNTLSRIELNNIASSTSVYCTLESIKAIGFDKVTISVDKLVEQLKKDFHEKDYIIFGVPNGYGGFHPDNKPRSIELAKKLDGLSHMMFGRKEDTEFFLSTHNGRAKLGFPPKANLVCSDAHTIGDIGNKTTWVKSEPTFEGLKQILFEPKYRVDCNDNIRKPYRTIESIRFEFPENTTLRNNHTNTEQAFCLSMLKEEIFFSPYFTCIIGGRGSGKSTIINIIAEKLGEQTEFFRNNKILVNGKTDMLKNQENTCITITGTNEIEFISQGKVEELSGGSHLTDLIFHERIKSIGNEYEEKEKTLLSRFQTIDEGIKIILDLETLNTNLLAKKASLENDTKIVASIENQTYKDLSQKISTVTREIGQIVHSKKEYETFIGKLSDLLLSPEIKNATDEYAIRLKQIIEEFEKIEEVTKIENGYSTSFKSFPDTDKSLEGKQVELGSLKQQIVDYFKSIGSTQDSIADVGRATSNIAIVTGEIAEIEKQIQSKKNQRTSLDQQASDIKDLSIQCAEIIKIRLEKINKDLDIQNDNVEKIRFEYRFGKERLLKALQGEFYEYFKAYHKPSLSWDNIYWCLNLIEPNEDFLRLTYDEYISQMAQQRFDRNLLYARVFTEIFDKESNFEIYKRLIKKHIYNISGNIEIIGYYGKSPLTSCSFGQRCTAVVVTLLMTGMKPLLIDEPEAHLDNRLIAEYLVDLIKEKKNERQIIFATHNANFVVNGDAELVHILEIPREKLFTEITSTTIENLTHRKSLLKLEGGEDAFRKRDRKLLSNTLR